LCPEGRKGGGAVLAIHDAEKREKKEEGESIVWVTRKKKKGTESVEQASRTAKEKGGTLGRGGRPLCIFPHFE